MHKINVPLLKMSKVVKYFFICTLLIYSEFISQFGINFNTLTNYGYNKALLIAFSKGYLPKPQIFLKSSVSMLQIIMPPKLYFLASST